jgi:apolipoprotein N-acyltransferase
MKLSIGISARDAVCSIGAALIGAAAFPPISLWPLSIVSVAFFVRLLRDKTSAQARSIGLVYGAAFAAGTMYWLFGIFGLRAISFVALMAGYFGILSTLVGMTKNRPLLLRAMLIGLFAVAVEWLRGDAWYLRFPWYTVPHALAVSPTWIAPARWIGTYGFSFVLWTVAGLGALGRPAYWLGFCLIPVFSFLLEPVQTPDRSALLLQVECESLIDQTASRNYDLTVLPEYAYHHSFHSVLSSKKGPVQLAQKLGCPVVFGAVDGNYGQPGFQNVAVVIDGSGNLVGTFPKQRPVPLMVDGRPGDSRPVFPVQDGVLGIGICYDFDAPEIAGSLVGDGATVLLCPTGDLMTWGRIQHIHHELLLRLRAVENDRWILRATSSGRTEAIDPHGVPSAECVEIGETGTVAVSYANRTSFALGGRLHVLGPAAALLTGLFVLINLGGFFYRKLRKTPLDMSTSRGQVNVGEMVRTAGDFNAGGVE